MEAREYFKRLSLQGLIDWYNNNVVDDQFSENSIFEYNNSNLFSLVNKVGAECVVEAAYHGGRLKVFDTCSEYFFFDDQVLRSFNTREEFEEMFLPAMIEEFENQK